MSYTEVLERIIKDSGKSSSQIALESKKFTNNGFTKSYISQIKNGKNKPASEEINYAIATICGADPDELQYEAYMHNAPMMVHEFIDQFTKFFFKIVRGQIINKLPRDKRSLLNKRIHSELPTYKIVKSIAKEGFGSFNIVDGAYVLGGVGEDINEKIILPSYGFLEQDDESMQPLIIKGDKIELDSTKTPKIGEIGMFKLNENDYVTRRYMEKGDKILLIPDNKKYETKSYAIDEIEIVAKVTAVIKEL